MSEIKVAGLLLSIYSVAGVFTALEAARYTAHIGSIRNSFGMVLQCAQTTTNQQFRSSEKIPQHIYGFNMARITPRTVLVQFRMGSRVNLSRLLGPVPLKSE